MAKTAVTVQLGNTDKMAVTVKQDKTAKQELKVKTLFMMRRENSDETTFTNFAIKGPVGASGTSGKDGTDGQGINLILHYRRKHAWPFLTQKKKYLFQKVEIPVFLVYTELLAITAILALLEFRANLANQEFRVPWVLQEHQVIIIIIILFLLLNSNS
jgi:hypothetical protein